MKKIYVLFAMIAIVLLTGCGTSEEAAGGDKTKKSQAKYVLATDDDFMEYSDFLKRYEYEEDVYKNLTAVDGRWYYIGEEEYVEIPDEIHGEEVIKYDGMFAFNEHIKGIKSTNPLVRSASGMFQYMGHGGELDLREFDVTTIVEANQIFQGAKLDTIIFGEKEFTELREVTALFKEAEIKDLDLSTLHFPILTELKNTFYGYHGENLNLNIPSLPKLESIEDFLSMGAVVENLEMNDFDDSNVSHVVGLIGNLTLGGDGIVDLSHWTLPNVERETGTTYDEDGVVDDSIEYIKAAIINGFDGERDMKGIDLSSLEGAIHFKDLLLSDEIQYVKVKGENEYKEYKKSKEYLVADLENGVEDKELYAEEAQWERAVKSNERQKKNVAEFEIEVAENR